ncbi:ABC transporter substrate-binding protein [Dongia sedimenti]|uniref:ABC transporter substrate-binding protein n=1 Tax=Dongia sedimenti TaxID=3064282 RepID=A0ABU0YS99_9PROT|nr:ABC transporter substrate-binding protein [Rhodospirillaceae bacterium R-7]
MPFLTRRAILQSMLAATGLGGGARSVRADPVPSGFEAALRQAAGQTVYFNAWGGDQKINDYILWAAGALKRRHGVLLKLVKLTDTAEAVSHVLAEQTAGRQDGGSVDLVWINGENFAAMKSAGLLFGPFTQMLPNFRLLDPARNPTLLVDFTIPTEGFESPWGMAQFTFFYDSARIPAPPRSMPTLLVWAEQNPGRFTYPAPPDFIGTTFLKQALHELTPDPAVLRRPSDPAQFATVAAPLWAYLDRLHPALWRAGRTFPESTTAQRQLLNDGEVDLYMAFNPADASSAIAQQLLPDTVRAFVPEAGSIANTHFLAIPFNANAKAGALVAANFLLSPEAQARKQDPAIWGDPTVLALDRLAPEERADFDRLAQGIATPRDLGRTLPEPHPSWVAALERGWTERYAH